jgi:hypothetical protein
MLNVLMDLRVNLDSSVGIACSSTATPILSVRGEAPGVLTVYAGPLSADLEVEVGHARQEKVGDVDLKTLVA